MKFNMNNQKDREIIEVFHTATEDEGIFESVSDSGIFDGYSWVTCAFRSVNSFSNFINKGRLKGWNVALNRKTLRVGVLV